MSAHWWSAVAVQVFCEKILSELLQSYRMLKTNFVIESSVFEEDRRHAKDAEVQNVKNFLLGFRNYLRQHLSEAGSLGSLHCFLTLTFSGLNKTDFMFYKFSIAHRYYRSQIK